VLSLGVVEVEEVVVVVYPLGFLQSAAGVGEVVAVGGTVGLQFLLEDHVVMGLARQEGTMVSNSVYF
jgi:hypothetical protein